MEVEVLDMEEIKGNLINFQNIGKAENQYFPLKWIPSSKVHDFIEFFVISKWQGKPLACHASIKVKASMQ